MKSSRLALTVVAAALTVAPLAAASAAAEATAATSPAASTATKVVAYSNCTALRKRFPHGVGRVGARDKTSSCYKVTNFYRSNAWYAKNTRLDRDKDGIACEKR